MEPRGIYERFGFDRHRSRLRWAQPVLPGSSHGSWKRTLRPKRLAREANLLGIFAGELIVDSLLTRSQGPVGDHQGKLVPV